MHKYTLLILTIYSICISSSTNPNKQTIKKTVNDYISKDATNIQRTDWFAQQHFNHLSPASSTNAPKLDFYMSMVWRLMTDVNIGIVKENEMIDAYGKQHLAIEQNDMHEIANDLSCDFQRRYGDQNFCFTKDLPLIEVEKCNANEEQLTLQSLLEKNGVNDNQCLRSIRKAFYPWTTSTALKIGLCNGKYDYECPVSTHKLKNKVKYNALQAALGDEFDVDNYYEFQYLWGMYGKGGSGKRVESERGDVVLGEREGGRLRMEYSNNIANEEELEEIINDEKNNGTPFKKHISVIAVGFAFFMSVVIAIAIVIGVYQQWKKKRKMRMMKVSGERDFVEVRMAKESTPLIDNYDECRW